VINDPVGATRNLPVDTTSRSDPLSKYGLTGPDESPAFGDSREGATRHLHVRTSSGSKPVSKDALTGPYGSPLQAQGDSPAARSFFGIPSRIGPEGCASTVVTWITNWFIRTGGMALFKVS
jgi:hypothetical protein